MLYFYLNNLLYFKSTIISYINYLLIQLKLNNISIYKITYINLLFYLLFLSIILFNLLFFILI